MLQSWCYYALIMSVTAGRTDSDRWHRGKVIERFPKNLLQDSISMTTDHTMVDIEEVKQRT